MEHTKSKDSPSVLVVDDERLIRDIITDFLGMEGYNVTAVSDGEAALEELKENNYQIVITDLKMPKIDGLQLLKKIQEMNKDLIPIMMTGYGTVETAIEAMKKGAYDYVLKPFKSEDLLMVVKRALEQQRLKQENIHLKEILSLYMLSGAISSSLSMDEILELILDSTMSETSADAVQLLLADDGTGTSFSEEKRKVSSELKAKFNIDLDNTDLGEPDMAKLIALFEEDMPVLHHGDDVGKVFIQQPTMKDIESYMALPLKAGGRIIGILQVFSFTRGRLPR